MAKRSLEQFEKRTKKQARKLTDQLEKELNRIRFRMEEKGKRNANADFYQAVTRSGNVRNYKLTGRLKNSINARTRKEGDSVEVILQAGGFSGGASVNYAAALEFGSKSRNIRPYFFLGRAVQAEKKDISKDLQKFLKMELKDL